MTNKSGTLAIIVDIYIDSVRNQLSLQSNLKCKIKVHSRQMFITEKRLTFLWYSILMNNYVSNKCWYLEKSMNDTCGSPENISISLDVKYFLIQVIRKPSSVLFSGLAWWHHGILLDHSMFTIKPLYKVSLLIRK